MPGIEFAFARADRLTIVEPGSPIVLAVLQLSAMLPVVAAFGVIVRTQDGAETVTVHGLQVDWSGWERLRRTEEGGEEPG